VVTPRGEGDRAVNSACSEQGWTRGQGWGVGPWGERERRKVRVGLIGINPGLNPD
jgi:hypothetical protein